jgi:hypothetical protein
MKKYSLVAGVLVAALALSACGSSPAARKASLDAYVTSLGSSSNLQVKFTGGFSGAQSAKASKILKALSFQMNFSNATGQPLSQSADTTNLELLAFVNGQSFVDLRAIDKNAYFKINVNELANIPGISLSASQLAAVQLAFGGRWFELTQSAIDSVAPPSDQSNVNATKDRAIAAKIIDALTNYIDTAPYKNPSSGHFTIHDTVLSFEKALYPEIKNLDPTVTAPPATDKNESFTLGISEAGGSATGASISVTAPNGTAGNSTGTFAATFTHANETVSAPTGATVVTQALLHELLGASPTV